MRVTVLFFVLALGALVAHPRAASAGEKVKTNQSTKVYSRPGEHGKVLLKLKSGQNMTVLAKEGRWLKVRVQGRTGYVPRSKVDGSSDDELARNTRRRPFVDGRGTKRGFVGESGPDDRVGADAVGDGGDDSSDSGDKGSASDDDGDSKSDKGDKADKGKAHDDDSGDDDSDDDDSGSKATKASKGGKAGKAAKGSSAKKHDDDSDDDSGDDDSDDDGGGKADKSDKGDKADKGDKGDDSDDSDSDVDDDKTGEPEKDSRPKAHVVKKTVAHEDRNTDSDEQFTATPDMVLYPSDQKGKWTFVEDDEGDAGWVLTSQLEMDGSGSDDDDGGGGGGAHGRQMDAHARLGVSFLQQGMRTAGAAPPTQGMLNLDNYNIGSSAVTLALGGDVLYAYGKKYVLGGEVTLDYAKTLLGGITVPNSTTSTGVSLMVFNLRAEAGYDFHKKNGMLLLGRLGYRYQSFGVDNYNDFTKNPAKLPQETIGAPTLGAALAIPQLTSKIGISASLDFVLAGASITQTKGLEDGSSPSEKAVYLGGVFTYRWKKDMDLQGTYNLDYASLDFGKPVATSMRAHTGTDVTRTDIVHTVTFGIVKGF